jgi:hypothetical protein
MFYIYYKTEISVQTSENVEQYYNSLTVLYLLLILNYIINNGKMSCIFDAYITMAIKI